MTRRNNVHLLRIAVAAIAAVAIVLLFVGRTSDHGTTTRHEVTLDSSPATDTSHAAIVEHGKLVVGRMCAGCHGADLSGHAVEDSAQEVSLATLSDRARVACEYSDSDFVCLLRDGIRRDGTQAESVMTAQVTRVLNDEDIHAVWLFARSLKIE